MCQRVWNFNWQGSDMRIIFQAREKMMYLNDPPGYQQFVDTMKAKPNIFLPPVIIFLLLILWLQTIPSDLRIPITVRINIIITHHKFKDIANQLADLRSTNFPDENFPSPRIKIVYVEDIYDEFPMDYWSQAS